MGGPIGSNVKAQDQVKFKDIPNNTHKIWIMDPGLRRNVFHCMGLCATLFFNGCKHLFGLCSIQQSPTDAHAYTR